MSGTLPPLVVLALGILSVSGCASATREPSDWIAWKARRLESVAGTNGWATLMALHWIREGASPVGSAPTNEVVLESPEVPAQLGTLFRAGSAVRFQAAPGAVVTHAGVEVTGIEMTSDLDPSPTRLSIGPVTLEIIDRGGRIGLRARSSQAPARLQFPGLRYHPYDPAWRMTGRFIPFPEMRRLQVPSVIGIPQEFPSPGRVHFAHKGRDYALDVALEPGEDDFFILFRDTTAGNTTYPTGRFLYVAPPVDASGDVLLDFNRAYTPPCGFSDFATCPLPPSQNRLPFPIPAGELRPGAHSAYH